MALALALHRAGSQPAAAEIMRVLAENALHSPALGMYWANVQPGYSWREAPTKTQATLMEAFSEVKNGQQSVAEMKLWLLKQKHTQHWENTRATADACYALLLRGSDWLAPSPPLQIAVGEKKIQRGRGLGCPLLAVFRGLRPGNARRVIPPPGNWEKVGKRGSPAFPAAHRPLPRALRPKPIGSCPAATVTFACRPARRRGGGGPLGPAFCTCGGRNWSLFLLSKLYLSY